jgi:trans-aconitate 2-methyltransferase
MADWSPHDYLDFADERAQPAIDLINQLPKRHYVRIHDLGCGPGNSTALLAKAFPATVIIGQDSSPAMIEKAKASGVNAQFFVGNIAHWATDAEADLIFSNAAFHWLPDHLRVMQHIIDDMRRGAVLAIQMPDNLEEPTHAMMREVAASAAFKSIPFPSSRSAVLGEAAYKDALSSKVSTLKVWRKTYDHRVSSHRGIAEFFAATGLKPYLDVLNEPQKAEFIRAYIQRIESAYRKAMDGSVRFGLPRLFILAEK